MKYAFDKFNNDDKSVQTYGHLFLHRYNLIVDDV